MRVNKWNDLRARKLSPDALRQVDEEIGKELLEMDLRALREAAELTQDELAERIEITQSQLSKLERRDDHRLSTLKRYVAALGGELEVVAVVQGKRVRLSDV
ncbi:MAG: helix-turn-helix transcriptional regulator [Acidobacteria bacterium]|nr:helix-turn-helix transcriptional regulator [Acidobacteriota bacterium]